MVYTRGSRTLDTFSMVHESIHDTPIDRKILIHEGNEGGMVATHRFGSRRTRYIDIKDHISHERGVVNDDMVQVEYFESRRQHADVLTEA